MLLFFKEIYFNCPSHRGSSAKNEILIAEGTSETHHSHAVRPNFHSHAFSQI